MKKILLTITAIFFATFSFSQVITRAISSSGGNYSSSAAYSFSSTIGEPIISTLTGTGFVFTQGFQQSFTNTTAPTAIAKDITVELDKNGNATITAAQIDNGSSDDSGDVTLSLDKTDFSCDDVAADITSNNYSIDFDGVNDWIDATGNGGAKASAASLGLPVSEITLEVYVNVKTFGIWKSMVGFLQDNGSFERGWDLETRNDNRFGFALNSVGGGGSLTYMETTNQFNLDQWYHIAGTYDGTTMKIYVDGVLENTSTAENGDIFYADSWLALGMYKDDDEANSIVSGMDEVRIFDYAKTQAEIQATMSSTLSGTETGLVAYYPFEDGPGSSTVSDLSGNGHNGILTNMDPATDWHTGSTASGRGTLVTMTATDANGNTSTATAIVTVEDNIAPTITLEGDASITHDAYTDYTDAGVTYADSCSATLVTTDDIDINTPGTYAVTYTATDESGNETIATRTVIVQDTTPPIAIAKDITVQLNASGNATITPADIDNGSSDASGDVTLQFGVSGTLNGTAFEGGDVLLQAPSGSIINGITFASYGAPNGTADNYTIGSCNANNSLTIVESYALGQNTVTIPASNGVFGDPCPGISKRLYITATYAAEGESEKSFDCSNLGTNTVTLTVTDDNENVSTATAIVTVEDNIDPTITLNGSATMDIVVGNSFADPGATAEDNCSATVTITGTLDVNTVASYVLYYKAIDSSGNESSTITRTVNIVDTTKPVITLTGSSLKTIEVGVSYSDLGATASDNYDGDISEDIVTVSNVDASIVAVYTVTYNVTDANLNTADQVTRTVNVVDTIDPVLTVTNTSVNSDASVCGATILSFGATSADASGSPTITFSIAEGTVFVIGTTLVTATATDSNGNSVSEGFNVTVIDTEDPKITLNGDASITHDAYTDYTDAGVTYADNCSATLVTTDDIDTDIPATYTVTYTATDESGNETIATRTVIVQDTAPPIAIVKDITVQLDASGKASISTTDIDNGSSDDSGDVTLSLDTTDFSCDDLGGTSTAITPTLLGTESQNTHSHAGGYNPNTNEFWYPAWQGPTVNVYDENHQFLRTFNSGQPSIMQLWMDSDSDTDYYVADWYSTFTRVDKNGQKVWSYTSTNGRDASGISTDNNFAYLLSSKGDKIEVVNKNTGVFVKVITLPGTVTIHGGLVIANNRIYIAGIAENWSTNPNNQRYVHQLDMDGTYISSTSTNGVTPYNTAFDGETMWVSANNNSITGIKISEGNAYGAGAGVPVILTVTDATGNVSSATATVTLEDNIAPTITLNGDASITHDAYTDYTDAGVTYADNCSATLVTTDDIDTDIPATYTVTYTATDESGNETIATRTVTVQDTTPPTAIAQDITVQLDASGKASISTTDIDNGSLDDSGDVTLSLDTTDFSCDDLGGTSTAITPTFIGTESQNTHSKGGGYNPNTNEFWYPQWSGRTVNVYDANHQFLRTFDSGQSTMMQLWMDTDSETDYYTANYSHRTYTRIDENGQKVWSYKITNGNNPGGISTDATYAYLLADGGNKIEVVDKNTGVFVKYITLPGSIYHWGGLVIANNRIYIGGNAQSWSTNPSNHQYVHQLDMDGTYISSTSTNGVTPYNTAFDGETMWVSGNSNSITGIKISEGNAYGAGAGVPVILTVTDATGNVSSATSTVTLEDNIAPTITLEGDGTITILVGDVFTDLGATASDNCSAKVVATGTVDNADVGSYILSYKAVDGSDNESAAVIRTVEVVDTTIPVLTLTGLNPQTIEVGAAYTELGATATDNYDDDTALTSFIDVDISNVNLSLVGTYTVTYNVTDANSNAAEQVERTIE
ncbi:immunoglobulin-like domain-containing protein, partial [Polaribacter glomeratus]